MVVGEGWGGAAHQDFKIVFNKHGGGSGGGGYGWKGAVEGCYTDPEAH